MLIYKFLYLSYIYIYVHRDMYTLYTYSSTWHIVSAKYSEDFIITPLCIIML